jgi:cell division protein FtsZ
MTLQQPVPVATLFDNIEDAAPEQTYAEDVGYEDVTDDLPPPAYRPQPARPVAAAHDADAAAFVAPRPRATGTPSPEALARLQAAVSKSPAARGTVPAPQQRVAAPAPQTRAAEKPRFGIGSLINRMAGHAEPQDRAQAPLARQQPPITSYDDEPELSADQERIEIPAFLRRQAN